MTRDQHLIRFGAYAYSALSCLRRAKLATPERRRGLLTLARADGQTARHHWQLAQKAPR